MHSAIVVPSMSPFVGTIVIYTRPILNKACVPPCTMFDTARGVYLAYLLLRLYAKENTRYAIK